MAHNITQRRNGVAEAAFALTPAWHGLGTVLDHPMSSAEALQAAHLDWRVVSSPLYYSVQDIPIKTHVANIREDNNELLGIVSKQYKIIQNVEAFAFLDQLIENHSMQYEAAFSLSGGKKVVLLGRLPKVDTIVKGDELLRYVLLSLHHDGSGAIRFGPTSVRVVCANTYSLAIGKGTLTEMEGLDREASIRHMGDVHKKLEAVQTLLQQANRQFDNYTLAAKQLVKTQLKGKQWDKFLDLMCPLLDPDDPDFTPQRHQRLLVTREAIKASYESPRQTLKNVRGTAWAAFNAVTEHIDHLPRRGASKQLRSEARFNVCLYGPGRDMKRRAFLTACRVARVAV